MPDPILNLLVEVISVQGHCPVYRVGDHFIIRKGHQLEADRPLCMHALQALCPYYVPLSRGIPPADVGLAGPQGAAYVQCMDPMRYTGGGTVTFRIRQEGKLAPRRFPLAASMPSNGRHE